MILMIHIGTLMISRNIDFKPKKKVSAWRKLAIGTWQMTGDCTVYCNQKVEVSKVLEYLKEKNKNSESKITLAHFCGRVTALAVEKYPQINSMIRFGNIYQREDINIFYQVASDTKGEDLSGAVVYKTNKKSLSEISNELNKSVSEIKSGNDKAFKKTKTSISLIPTFFMRKVLDLLGFFLYGLNLWTPLLGTPKDCFGSVMITNIGSLGVESAFVPLVAYSRVPLIMCLGKVIEEPYVKDGHVLIGKFVNMNWTLDHRLIDGVVGAKMMEQINSLFDSPTDSE
jgi:pyruvate/2-oxoglutarate dehydrogenase complex dihydrolipoamide acyltransferase (E2) component